MTTIIKLMMHKLEDDDCVCVHFESSEDVSTMIHVLTMPVVPASIIADEGFWVLLRNLSRIGYESLKIPEEEKEDTIITIAVPSEITRNIMVPLLKRHGNIAIEEFLEEPETVNKGVYH